MKKNRTNNKEEFFAVMRKIFYALLIIIMCSSSSYSRGIVYPDPEVHRVVGGLYSLAAAVCLNDNIKPSVSSLAAYFKDIPSDWQNSIKIERVDSAIWVGVTVSKYSEARHFLRDHADELGIAEQPGNPAWIGGSSAWLKAGDIVNGHIRSTGLKAAKGSGSDSNVIFLSAKGQDTWWQMNPTPGTNTAAKILSKWGMKNAPELHKLKVSGRTSIYESVKPSEVRKKPADIHIGTKKSSFDMSTNIGDVIFDPIPYRQQRMNQEAF